MNKNMIKTLLMSAFAVTMALAFVGCKKDEAPADDTTSPKPSPSASVTPSATPDATPAATPSASPDATPATTPTAPAGKMGDDKGKMGGTK